MEELKWLGTLAPGGWSIDQEQQGPRDDPHCESDSGSHPVAIPFACLSRVARVVPDHGPVIFSISERGCDIWLSGVPQTRI